METISKRRQQATEELGLTDVKEVASMEKSIAREMDRKNRKQRRREEIQQSDSYKFISGIATAMDKYFLDPLIGLIPGVGDVLSTLFALPFVYVSLFKVRSIPLTLAVVYYNMLDALLGIIPFWIGNICDIFYRANLINFRLIKGFVEDDKAVIEEVNRKAVFMGIMIVVVAFLIYWLVGLVVSAVTAVWEWLGGLFA